MHYLPLVGMILLAAGIVVFRIEVPSSQALTLVGSGLTGLGLGATVAPALFVAGFSLPAFNLQRVFAIVELFRAVAAFMVAPIFAHLDRFLGGKLPAWYSPPLLARVRSGPPVGDLTPEVMAMAAESAD